MHKFFISNMYIVALDSLKFFKSVTKLFDRIKIAREKREKDVRTFEHFREVCIHA